MVDTKDHKSHFDYHDKGVGGRKRWDGVLLGDRKDIIMVIYKSLEAVMTEESLNKFGTLYVNREWWDRPPNKAELYLLAGDDELEDLDTDGNPMFSTKHEVQYFF